MTMCTQTEALSPGVGASCTHESPIAFMERK
jgi:hypothetical protein